MKSVDGCVPWSKNCHGEPVLRSTRLHRFPRKFVINYMYYLKYEYKI